MPFVDTALNDRYPTLSAYSSPLAVPEREVVGREKEIRQMMAAMQRPELSNVLLLAPAGAGKTTLVQAAMMRDTDRVYMEVDLARMIANLPNTEAMAGRLKALFDEAEAYSKDEGHELVLFIDEFHQVAQLSAAAVEALKPVLAASGARGLRLVVATTFDEFNEHVASNLPLVERLQRINLMPPNAEVTVEILRGMADRYKVGHLFHDDRLFELIYEYTDRYIPASTQPRKSILVLDAMVGWHRYLGREMDKSLLADVLLESTGINVTFRVDATRIQEQLDSKVISQKMATSSVARRLQLCVADLHDKSRPISSFLFLGSSGVGKQCADYTRVPVLSDDGSVAWKAHGELVPGDYVFNRAGDPVQVLGHFPQGVQDIYRVTFWDGRHLDVGSPHLWPVYTSKMRIMKHAGQEVDFRVMTTKDMYDQGVLRPTHGNSLRGQPKFFVPAGGAVQWPERNFEVDPWVLGVLIGNGSLTQPQLTLSSDDAQTVHEMGRRLGVVPKPKSADDYSWLFPTGERWGRGDKLIQTRDYLASVPELIGVKSGERRIPKAYLTASVEQRWELVRGLFDTDGTISNDDRRNISYSTFSKGLAEDLRELLFSLGVSNSLNAWTRTKDDGRVLVEYDVHVKVGNPDKAQFFSLPRKKALALSAAELDAGKQRIKKFDMLGIVSIEKLPEQHSASCIYVDDPEHLYQAGEFVVTHNTELVKQLARLLFGDDQRHLIRFDMSEFANENTLDYFRDQLTQQVSNMGHSVLLFDEIEKASAKIVRLMLQVLDDGRLTNRHGRQVSFLNTYIVLTTNAGSEIFQTIAQYNVDDTGSGEQIKERMTEIRRSLTRTQSDNKFPPELLGRIDAIVPFQPLSRETQRTIVTNKLAQMRREVMAKHGVTVKIDGRVLEYLIENKTSTDSDAGGARVAIARMTEDVTTEIAAFVNAHPQERVIDVWIQGKMTSEDKEMLKSEAKVMVTPVR